MKPVKKLGLPVATCRGANLEQQRAHVCAWGRDFLGWRAASSSKPTAVFDIDATLLHNKRRIEPVIELYDYARKHGVTCFMITARSTEGKEYTRHELSKLGIVQPRHLFLHPHDEPLETAEDAGRVKKRHRDRIASKGYDIVMNVGDAFSDHYVPGAENRELHRALGSSHCGVWVDPHDGVAHIKLGHP